MEALYDLVHHCHLKHFKNEKKKLQELVMDNRNQTYIGECGSNVTYGVCLVMFIYMCISMASFASVLQ